MNDALHIVVQYELYYLHEHAVDGAQRRLVVEASTAIVIQYR
mgnify:CR=1 FL=1